jgi:hypothetical protein
LLRTRVTRVVAVAHKKPPRSSAGADAGPRQPGSQGGVGKPFARKNSGLNSFDW